MQKKILFNFANMKRLLLILSLLAGLWTRAAAHTDSTRVELLQQRRIPVAKGQYSGITHVEDGVYAVVHDKSAGGGLHFFTLNFRRSGRIASARSFETDAGGPIGRDNEDVVFVPETRTLFVAAEGEQSIREYDLSGRPTGRELSIPEALKECRSNAGFESLAYGDGSFWTTTEAPLPGEELHRLQRFSLESLHPLEHYSYRCDTPLISAGESKKARAYACGISAMTVLEDGRLAVLEREIYVPGGSLFAALRGAISRTRIYLVDPLHDASEVLEKTLLTEFWTSAGNLANFEGMCLGPKLEDGRQVLLLIADSQDGAGGLTKEYLRVILYTPSAL